jgi:broad specificity phosphatase PhoE
MSNRSSLSNLLWLGAGATAGGILSALLLRRKRSTIVTTQKCEYCLAEERDKRARLPTLIILVRHGESEGNADHTLWRKKADNSIDLSSNGVKEAEHAGEQVEKIFKTYDHDENLPNIKRVHLIVSPFERTLQTSIFMRPPFDHRIVRTEVEPRIREQEFGNLQGDEFERFREEQRSVGRFWYRFPTGESGADVYDRVKSWWFESVLSVNQRCGYDPVDALVIVTHGLTMRFVLMQLFHWSPTTFHSVWNAHNCDLYVLRKDLEKPGLSPYVLDDKLGGMPQSSVDIAVTFLNGKSQLFKLSNYLSIPPPRTTRFEIIRDMLVEQYPSISSSNIADLTVFQGHTTSPIRATIDKMNASRRSSEVEKYNAFERIEREASCRFPNLKRVVHGKSN